MSIFWAAPNSERRSPTTLESSNNLHNLSPYQQSPDTVAMAPTRNNPFSFWNQPTPVHFDQPPGQLPEPTTTINQAPDSYWNQPTPNHFDQPPGHTRPPDGILTSKGDTHSQSSNPESDLEDGPWGDAIEIHQDSHVRIGFRNINSLPLASNDNKHGGILQDISDGKLDVLGCSEINVAWQNVSVNASVSRRFRSNFEHSRFMASNNRTDSPILRHTQYGGTLLGSIMAIWRVESLIQARIRTI